MNFNEYQMKASRTANHNDDVQLEYLNYTLGLVGESGEFAEIVKKSVFHKHLISRQEFAKELGDCLWYISQLARLEGYTLEEIAERNIEKLEKRYPEKFNTADSVARVDTKEQTKRG